MPRRFIGLVSGAGAGTVTNVTGTANQIDVATGTTTPVISLDPAINLPGSLTVGTGASIASSGSGTIDATTLLTATWASPGTIGTTTPNTGSFTGFQAGTNKFNVTNVGLPNKSNNINLAGQGFAIVTGVTSQKAEVGADVTLLSVTPAATVGTYRASIVVSVSAATAATLGWTATWTDSNGNAQAPTNLAIYQTGIAAPALTLVLAAAGNLYGDVILDINNAATAIVIKLTFAGTSFAAKVSATLERLI